MVHAFHPFWGIPDQPPIFGTITTSYVLPGDDGIAAAKTTLGRRILNMIVQPDVPATGGRSYLQAAEALAPEKICQGATEAVRTLSQLEGTPFSQAELRDRLRLLRDLEGGVRSRATNEVMEKIQHFVDARVADLRNSVLTRFTEAPGGILETIEEAKSLIGEFEAPENSQRGLSRVSTILDRMTDIYAFEDWVVPETMDMLRQALPIEARKAADEALNEIVTSKTWDAVRSRLDSLENVFQELETAGLQLREQIRAVVDELVERERLVRAEQEELRQGVALVVPGPDESAVLTGMRTEAGCSDLETLVSLLRDEFQHALRNYAADHHPYLDARNARLPDLLLEIEIATITDLVERTVEGQLGIGHRLFELVEKFGVPQCAQRLFEKAGPTCFHGGRATEAFGQSPTEILIVRFPKARTSGDERVRSELRSCLEKLAVHCHVEDAPERDRMIYVTRTHVGWPIGIEQGNHALAQRFNAATREGHRSQLHGVLPDAHAGQASVGYQELVSRIAGGEEETQTGPDIEEKRHEREDNELEDGPEC